MTGVLVGGKRRQEVLDRHLRRMQDQSHEPSQSTPELASACHPIHTITITNDQIALFPVYHAPPGSSDLKPYRVSFHIHPIDDEHGKPAYLFEDQWKTWKNPGRLLRRDIPSVPFYFSILNGLYLAKTKIYPGWDSGNQGNFDHAVVALKNHFEGGEILTSSSIRWGPSKQLETVIHNDINSTTSSTLPLWTQGGIIDLQDNDERGIAYTGFSGNTIGSIINGLFRADIGYYSFVRSPGDQQKTTALALTMGVKIKSGQPKPFRFDIDARARQYRCIPMTITEIPTT